MTLLRRAVRNEQKVSFDYRDAAGHASRRTVWPFALGFFDRALVLVAWCELRQSTRHFRTAAIEPGERYPRRRQALLDEWRRLQGIREP